MRRLKLSSFFPVTQCFLSRRCVSEQQASDHRSNAIRPEDVEWADATFTTGTSQQVQFEDVVTIDTFSKARIINFAKRYHRGATADTMFHVRTIQTADSTTHYHCKAVVVPPHVSSSQTSGLQPITGEGLASNPKDAEMLAAMHAERIIDALGYQVYTLPSMQRKHADAARLAGRWAPYPEDATKKSAEVVLPLPYRRLSANDETENGTWLLLDTTVSQFRQHPYAILSPCLLDCQALHRVKSLFSALTLSFDQHAVTSETSDSSSSVSSKSDADTASSAGVWYVSTIHLPQQIVRHPHIKATGKSTDRQTALFLAAMHAELLVDYYGACLFPRDPAIQNIHAQAVIKFGRYAPTFAEAKEASSLQSISRRVMSIGLKQLHVPIGDTRKSTRSGEEEWIRQHAALSSETNEFTDPHPAVNAAQCRDLIERFFDRRQQKCVPLCQIVGAQFKSTLVLPVPAHFGVRGGVGLAPTSAEADTLAMCHAVDTLCTLGIDFLDSSDLQRFNDERSAAGLLVSAPSAHIAPTVPSPPALKRVLEKGIGRTARVIHITPVDPRAAASEDPPIVADAPEVDFKAAQRADTRDLWDLTADFKDFIIVKDNLTSLSMIHTLMSPRYVDVHAMDRLVTFLSGVGKRVRDVIRTTVTQNSQSEFDSKSFRAMIHLPLPPEYGDRLAVGVAATEKEAELLAAMHAELIIDTVGYHWYSNLEMQKKHAATARSFGRYASMVLGGDPSVDPTTPSPPYLKKPSAAELSWITMIKHRESSRGTTNASSASSTSSSPASSTTSGAVSTPSASSGAAEDGLAFLLSKYSLSKKMTYIGVDDLDLVSKHRVQYYLRRLRAKKMDVTCRKIMEDTTMHVAELEVPVPARFGPRVAIGVAPTQRHAEVLCFTHAELIIDALGIHIFNLPGMQTRHVRRVMKLGRWAPLPNEDVKLPSNTPSPLPLSVGEGTNKPLIPRRPNQPDASAWQTYISACELYVEACEKYTAALAFQNEKCPKTDNALLDESLDEAERSELDTGIKQKLTQYCLYAKLPYPTMWLSRTVGPTSKRVCYTTVPVPGFDHILARGVAVNKESSQRRAAMHACALLRRLEPDFVTFEKLLADGKISTIKPREQRGPTTTSYDNKSNAFTPDGIVRVVDLYSVCFGLSPPVVLNKHRLDGSHVTHITTVEITDEDGKTWVGRADEAGKRGNSTAAYEDLFKQLQDGAPGFQALCDLVQKHPHLDPEHVVDVTFPDDLRNRMRKLIDNRRRPSLDDEDEDEPVAKLEPTADADASTEGLSSKLTPIDEEEVQYRSHALKERHLAKVSSTEYQETFAAKRKSLSIHQHKDEIIETIRNNQVTIICGTTGCGKTTQIPQFILDDATERGIGGDVSMIVTQPRRLSAVSIAQRIASERMEAIGDACGYTIRLDAKPGRHINFVTSGVLLRLFHSSPTLDGVNYVIIDEIHERDINSDFLLILVRDLIRTRKDLRVVLMSATLSSDQFASFFNNAPVINVVGYVHPVKELFVEDLAVVAKSKSRLTPLLTEVLPAPAAEGDIADTTSTSSSSAVVKQSQGFSARVDLDDVDSLPMITTAKQLSTVTPTSDSSQQKTQKYGFLEATGEVDFLAVQFAVDYALEQLPDINDSSVLVFLPGWTEIVKAKDILSRNSKFHIITLHSSVGAEEQMLCFQPPPEGKVKLILSTNIAESGVTIDDVAVVVDVGRAKEKSYVMRRGRTTYGRNEMGSMSQLVTVYASRANCVQRRGRVGRTRPGICIRLYTKKHFETVHDFQTPEMLRQPLDALCLQILALGLGDPVDFLRQAIEPPSMDHIESAMRRLHELGGVTAKGYLTPLGLHLAKLPVAPRIGKMILVGAVLRCLDSALTIAACSDTDVYSSSREAREAVKAHREDLSMDTLSDHISSVNGFNFWVTAHYTKSPQEVMYALQERMLSVPQLLTVSRYKRQFFEILCHHGFLPDGDKILRQNSSLNGDIFVDKSHYSHDKTHVGLVKSVVGSGLFPNICMYRGKKLMRSKLDNRLAPASSSVLAQNDVTEALASPFFVYEEVVQQSLDANVSRLVLRGLTSVPLWSVLLMGTSSMPVSYRDDLNIGIIDDWILFRANFSTLELIRRFKKDFHRCLTRKFVCPSDEENNRDVEEFRQIVRDLLDTAVRPNELVMKRWEEKGAIVEPITEATASSESAKKGDTSEAGESPVSSDQEAEE